MLNVAVAKPKEAARMPLEDKRVVILCGGRGSRLGQITDALPKPLVHIHDKPLLWYTFLILHEHGFRQFIFPLGYKGEMIKEFVNREFGRYNCKFHFVDTGEDTHIAKRLEMVLDYIPERANFFLANGDTFFQFDLEKMYQLHIKDDALLTLSSIELISKSGIILEENGKVVDFVREVRVPSFSFAHNHSLRGYIHTGLAWINKDAMHFIDLETCGNLERELFPKIIKMGRAVHYKLEGKKFAIETQQDLDIINQKIQSIHDIGDFVKKVKKGLSDRHSLK